MFRSSPPEVFSKKDAVQIRSKPTGEQPHRSAISTKLLCNFIEITPTHRCTPENPKNTTQPQNTSPQENTSGKLLLCVKRVLKNINYKKLLFTVAKKIN